MYVRMCCGQLQYFGQAQAEGRNAFAAARDTATSAHAYFLRDDESHDLRTVEVKQENRELDSREMYRCQKNDLAAK